MDYERIRNNIENKIRQKGLVRENLLISLDIARGTYLNMFKRRSVNLNTLEKIAESLDVSVIELLSESNNNVTSEYKKELKEMKPKYFRAVELLAMHGIKLDLGKFESGLITAFGKPFLFEVSTQKPTH